MFNNSKNCTVTTLSANTVSWSLFPWEINFNMIWFPTTFLFCPAKTFKLSWSAMYLFTRILFAAAQVRLNWKAAWCVSPIAHTKRMETLSKVKRIVLWGEIKMRTCGNAYPVLIRFSADDRRKRKTKYASHSKRLIVHRYRWCDGLECARTNFATFSDKIPRRRFLKTYNFQ